MKTDFLKASCENGAFEHVWIEVLSKLYDLRERNFEEYDSKTRRLEIFIETFRDWNNKEPDYRITKEDLYWLADLTSRLNISELVWAPILKHKLQTDYDGFKENVSEFKKITGNSSEEFATLLLELYSNNKGLQLPHGHDVWLSLGVNNSREHRELGLSQIFKEAQWAKTGELNGAEKAFVVAAYKASKRRGTNTRTGIIKRLESIEDTDTFSERVGTTLDLHGIISLAHLSPQEAVIVESWRTGELSMMSTRQDYGRAKKFAESKGIPPKALYVLKVRAMKKLQKVVNMTQ
ncbi:hypothetical protein ACFLYI_02055 [Chloroflexota bacterium]